MAVAWGPGHTGQHHSGQGHSGRRSRRNAGSLPVLRWLQVGAATAGLGVALVAAPAAQADTGTASSGADSSQGAGPSSGADTSPDTGSGGAAADGDDGSADTSGAPGQDTSDAAGEDAPEAIPEDPDESDDSDDSDDSGESDESDESDEPDDSAESDDSAEPEEPEAISSVSDRDADSSDQLAENAIESADLAATAAVETLDSSETGGMSPDTSEPPAPEPADGQTTSVDATTTSAVAPVAATLSAPDSPAAASDAMSRPDYPEWVSAPVTWASILTESLSWFGLGALSPNLPVPQFPVPDLIAGVWVGMRRLHYTFFNSAPRLELSGYTADPWSGVITGNLGGHDVDGDVITYAVTSAPVNGKVQIAEDGTYTYTPDSEFAGTGGTDTFTVLAQDTSAANRWHVHPNSGLLTGLTKLLTGLGLPAPPNPSAATVSLTVIPVLCGNDDDSCGAAPADQAPSITVHNNSDKKIWVYNLPTSGVYSIAADFVPVAIEKSSSAAVTLAVGTGAPGTPENRIYIVEGDAGFTLPVDSASGVDAFNPTAVTAGNSFLNYNFLEYFLYPANGGYEYTIDTSYIDEWSLPVQYKFTIPHGAEWTGAKSGATYGFNDFDTVVSQLTAAKGPYQDLVWSGGTPWAPQPPPTIKRIIGPDKVWTAQSQQPPANIHMNKSGWVPTSYQDFVQYGPITSEDPEAGSTVYPYAYTGHEYSSSKTNFDFWRYEVAAPGGTPYPIALRTAAHLDGYPAVNGVWGFFTYPNDETAGQFTNIPNTVSLDIYVHGSSDGVSDSVIEGGTWLYSSAPAQSDTGLLGSHHRDRLVGSDATDTFILDSLFKSRHQTPLVMAEGQENDIIAIDKTALPGATSVAVDIVDSFWFLGGGHANYDSQFIYDRASGYLYYDQDPDRFGYTGVLADLSLSKIDPASAVFVL